MNYLAHLKIGFIGAGNMACSIIGGLVRSGLSPAQLFVSNPSVAKLEQLKRDYPNINTLQDNAQLAAEVDIILLAVKPQVMATMLQSIKHLHFDTKLIISVAAGVETQTISEGLDSTSSLAIVRSMPNTPSLVGVGATGLFANSAVSELQIKQTNQIFNAVGICEWINQESQMDLVTAISGSGPAHYFLFLEAVTQYAIDSGMQPEVARNLASQTALGAASMVQQNSDISLETLRHNVTSPGGTTAAAIDSLNANGLTTIISQALEQSVLRGKELAKNSKT